MNEVKAYYVSICEQYYPELQGKLTKMKLSAIGVATEGRLTDMKVCMTEQQADELFSQYTGRLFDSGLLIELF